MNRSEFHCEMRWNRLRHLASAGCQFEVKSETDNYLEVVCYNCPERKMVDEENGD